MKIKFNSTIYNLVDYPNIHGTHFQATIEKDGVSIDDLLEDSSNSSTITVYDDEDNVAGIYTGYTDRVAVSIGEHIGLEFENTNIEAAIIDLQEQLASITQSNGILEIIIPNVSNLPKTAYNENIISSMSLVNKSFSNPDVIIDDFTVTIANGSVTVSGIVTGTTDITLFLTNAV